MKLSSDIFADDLGQTTLVCSVDVLIVGLDVELQMNWGFSRRSRLG